MKKTSGYSMVELLVATAIMGIVLAVASQGIVMALTFHRNQQAVVTAQSKLRNVNQAISQELRASALGGLANYPVNQSAYGLSFMLLDGGVGYQVLSNTSTSLSFVADAISVSEIGFSSEVLLINDKGDALLIPIDPTNVSSQGDNKFELQYPTCVAAGSIELTDLLIFSVQAVGFEFDTTDQTLYRQDANGRLPLAFDMNDFEVERIDNAAGTETIRLDITSKANYWTVGGEEKQRTYSGQIDLPQADAGFNRRIKGDVNKCY